MALQTESIVEAAVQEVFRLNRALLRIFVVFIHFLRDHALQKALVLVREPPHCLAEVLRVEALQVQRGVTLIALVLDEGGGLLRTGE